MLDRLVIGTANWGRDYNGHCVDETQQQLIMEYMKEVGIEWLDVADIYGTRDIGKGQFKRILKTTIGNIDGNLDVVIAHKRKEFSINNYSCKGLSIYSAIDLPLIDKLNPESYIELPFGILNRAHSPTAIILHGLGHVVIARSIFCKGKALKYFSPRECIDFVLMNPRIDKVILGVDSVDQLRDNIAHLVKMEKFEHNEEVDTRKF